MGKPASNERAISVGKLYSFLLFIDIYFIIF